MKVKVCVITGSRADYGILRPLCKRIYCSSNFKLDLIVTGAHLSEIHGYTINEIKKDFPDIIKQVEIVLANSNTKSIVKSCSLALLGISELLETLNPNLVILLGDRYEIMIAAMACMLHGIPIAHIHGGEISEGSNDDKMRHCITKLSNIHFVSCEENKKRVIQLGESPNKVFNFGALGLDNLVGLKGTAKKEILKKLSIQNYNPKLLIATIHPETVHQGNSERLALNLCSVLSLNKDLTVIWTLPNADEKSFDMRRIIIEKTKGFDNIYLFESLGSELFLNCLSISDGIIGNSSSGIIEAPFLKKGTINIGIRQKGRVKTSSIITCSNNINSIQNAINKLFSDDFKSKLASTKSLYGEGGTSKKIMEILNQKDLYCDSDKKFYDL